VLHLAMMLSGISMLIILKVVYLSKHFNILRKLKYHLSRTNLDKLYLVYIRPLFEYACEMYCWMLRTKTGLIFIYNFILVEIAINMFVYNSLHYFPNTTYKRYRCVIRRNEESPFLNTALTWANFQFVGYLLWWSDLLNIICKGNALLFGHSFNIL
jgi:hypothetical protein